MMTVNNKFRNEFVGKLFIMGSSYTSAPCLFSFQNGERIMNRECRVIFIPPSAARARESFVIGQMPGGIREFEKCVACQQIFNIDTNNRTL